MSSRRALAMRFWCFAALAVGSAASAHADTLQLLVTSFGSVQQGPSQSGIVGTENVVAQMGGVGTFLTFDYSLGEQPPVGGVVSGTGAYTGLSGVLDFTFSYNPSNVLIENNGMSQAVDATVSFVPTLSTGSYAGTTGSGTLDLNLLVPAPSSTSGFSTSSLSAVLETPTFSNTVPTPLPKAGIAGASLLALMGLGRISRRTFAA